MTQWEYEITVHKLPEVSQGRGEKVIKCDQTGQCFLHDTSHAGIGWLETLFAERGKKGWELVQSGYHHQELLCIWKKRREVGKGS